MALTFEERRKISRVSIPARCINAVWLLRHPWHSCFLLERDGESTEFFYHPLEKVYYYRRPGNAVKNDWQRARGMDQALSDAKRYFSEPLGIHLLEVSE